MQLSWLLRQRRAAKAIGSCPERGAGQRCVAIGCSSKGSTRACETSVACWMHAVQERSKRCCVDVCFSRIELSVRERVVAALNAADMKANELDWCVLRGC